MKRISCYLSTRFIPRRIGPAVLLTWLFVFPGFLAAQNDTLPPAATDTTVTATEAPPAEEAPGLISPALDFKAVQKGDNTVDLRVGLRTKLDGANFNLYKMKVSFYRVAGEEEIPLGFKITDGTGKAVINVKTDSLPTDAEGKLHFKAVFAGNKAMESAEETASFKKARLEMTPVKEDSLMSVTVKLSDAATATAVKDATIGLYVKRLFMPLKVGEGTTDENGEATIEFPAGLPGDAKGNLTLIARLDENEMYGNLESTAVQPWGVAVSDKSVEQPRALWSSHPPLWMLITFFVLMLAVWGHYVVIVYELFRLRKEQPSPTKDATNS